MAQTKSGAKLAALTIKKKYGDDFYRHIGKLGGHAPASKPKGFAAISKEALRAASAKGGRISRRGPAK